MYTEVIIRCMTNGIEAILTIIAFYFFLKVKSQFDRNVAIMTALITLQFMMRNTSPIGWIPLLLIKIYKEKSFKAFLISGLLIAIPLLFILILIDTIYYGSCDLVITSVNFLKVNLLEGLSKYFGDDPFYWYILVFLPGCVTVLYPFVFNSYYIYYKD